MTDLKKLADTPRTDALVQITEGAIEIFDRLPMLNHARTLELECTAIQQELVACKRAKQENDERFMLERDEARREVGVLLADVRRLTDANEHWHIRAEQMKQEIETLRATIEEMRDNAKNMAIERSLRE